MKIINILEDAFIEDFVKKAKEKYNTDQFEDFKNSLKETESFSDSELNYVPLSGFGGARIFEYKAINQNRVQYIIELSYTNYIDDQHGYLYFLEEKPTKKNIESLLDSKNIEIGDEI